MGVSTREAPADDVEQSLRRAVTAYCNTDLPGAERTAAYNQQRLEYRMGEEHDPQNLRIVERVRAAWPPPARVLELGAGTGGLCSALARAGYDVAGVEPNDDGVEASRQRARRYPGARVRIEKGVAEALPFADGAFDVVVSTQVIEHVPDVDGAARECLRVLAPGGVAIHYMPNYAFPREPHYGVPWPPRVSRRVGRLYLRALGRDTRLFDEQIFPTTTGQITGVFRRAGFVEVENRYAAEVAEKLAKGELSTPSLQPLVGLLRKTRVLGLISRAVMALELYPAIILVAKKPR
jgi:2-polyprenyl-3-methyl-5-hydroxy-6-metoxy-1,4-benzoquinol methylase